VVIVFDVNKGGDDIIVQFIDIRWTQVAQLAYFA